MIVEERTYRIAAGRLPDYLGLYQEMGLEIQKRVLGNLIGYFTTEIGELNHVVAIWGYDSLDDRLARRKKMMADPAWQEYLKRVDGLLDTQTSRILIPTEFSPLQ